MDKRFSSIQDQNSDVAATGGVVAALLTSACCIRPLVLITLGANSAWIANLTALKAYQPELKEDDGA